MLKQQASCSSSGTDRVDLFAVGGEDGLTPLHDAIQNKHFSIVSMYLDAITANDRRTGDDGLIRMVKMKTGEEGKTVWGYTRDSADMTALIQVWRQPFSFFAAFRREKQLTKTIVALPLLVVTISLCSQEKQAEALITSESSRFANLFALFTHHGLSLRQAFL